MKQKRTSPAVATADFAAFSEADLNPLPAAESALVPGRGPGDTAVQSADQAAAPPALRDAHGFDPAEYRWVPVLRKPRADGWTPQRQVDFIAALADSGCVEEAAREVGLSASSCYRLRRAPDGQGSPPPGTPRSRRRRAGWSTSPSNAPSTGRTNPCSTGTATASAAACARTTGCSCSCCAPTCPIVSATPIATRA